MEEKISLTELVLEAIFFGYMTYIIARIVQGIYLNSFKKCPIKKMLCILLISQLISIILTVAIWRFWTSSYNTIWDLLFVPALFSEVIIFVATVFLIQKKAGL